MSAGVVDWFADPANYEGPGGVPTRLVEHLGYTAASVGIACLVALPLALWLGHVGRGGLLAVQVSNVGRAVPTLAVLVLLFLAPDPFGSGLVSQLTAFVLFAIPPVLTNAYVGMREVDRDVVDAARGMGLSGWQVLKQVELPLAAPLLLTGVRQAALQVVATVAIAALVAGGGLGRIVQAGFGVRDQAQVLAGALLIAALALLVELAFEALQRLVAPSRPGTRARLDRDPIVTDPGMPKA